MRFWSEGLGDGELVMGLGRAKAVRKGEEIALNGIIESPAPWEYEVKIDSRDWSAILNIATGRKAVDYIAAHAAWRDVATMIASIVKFVCLLAYYRSRAVLMTGRHMDQTHDGFEQPGTGEL
ncbi:MAG: hypothetical protein KGO02_24850 [Alphaproteobacteria bacterium]|nr:hypothetical protein [Alphaproteobacteria bacterium]